MLRNRSLLLLSGQPAGVYASLLWDRMDDLQRSAILWNMPAQARRDVFEDVVLKADLVAVGMGVSGPETLAWMQTTDAGASTAAVHLATACASVPIILDYGRAMLKQIEWQCLFCMLPSPWHGARRVAEALGFVRIAAFPKCCRIASHGRCVDAVMLQWLAPSARPKPAAAMP